MTKHPSVNAWKSFLLDRGLPSDLVNEYLSYAEKIIENQVPVIFELEHLSNLVGIEYTALCGMVNSAESYYREFSIKKRKGGVRIIDAPYPSLLLCQNWIYKNILIASKVHFCVHGFVSEKSILNNALPHVGKKVVLKMDLKNFFPSIPINWVINYFSGLGYAKNVSFYLASLCCLYDCLPQGASTSPYLSNVLLYSLDERIFKLAKCYGLDYTRYADDLTFSGNYIPHDFSNIVSQIVSGYGLSVNKEKTRLHTRPGQRIVTGISVSSDKPKIPKSTKRQLRKEVYFIKKYGIVSHMSKLKIRKPNYLKSLEGKLNFWFYVEPENKFARESIRYLREIIE